MAFLIDDCPRCGTSKITFDVAGSAYSGYYEDERLEYYEVFCICRACRASTIFVATKLDNIPAAAFDNRQLEEYQYDLKEIVEISDYVKIVDIHAIKAPAHVPIKIANGFNEGSRCYSIGCWNAAGVMFRACIDVSTKSLLPPADADNGPNKQQRSNLAPRLEWLFANNLLPRELESLATTIREDGNDGAHDLSLSKEEATDLLEFTELLLERIYTEPERIRLATERRKQRRMT